MTATRDHRTAADATPVQAGDTVALTITTGFRAERGTYTSTLVEHPDVPGLLIALAGDRVLVAQRPNGDQPYPLEVVA